MASGESLCCGCLVTNRRMYRLKDLLELEIYRQMNVDPVYDIIEYGSICWQCRAILVKINVFQKYVRFATATLRSYLVQDPLLSDVTPIKKESNLQWTEVKTTDYPAAEPVKNEHSEQSNKDIFEFVKSEDANFDNGYSEPENFVDNLEEKLQVKVAEKRGRKPKEKTKKSKEDKKKGKKEKVKGAAKKRKTKLEVSNNSEVIKPEQDSTKEESSDGLTDLDSMAEYYKDEPQENADTTDKDKPEDMNIKADPDYDEKDIQRIVLTQEEMLKERLNEATCEYYTGSPYKCDDCIVGFKYERTLKSHMETKHDESVGKHVCPVCSVRFPTGREQAEHTRAHLTRYKCCSCGKLKDSLVAMVKHVKNHKEYKCELCDHVSANLFRHETHMSRQHKEKPKCVDCGKMFSSRKTYRYHLNVIHKGQNRFPCPHCGKVYQWKSNLWRHIKNHKARDSGELYCVQCDKKFSSVATFQQHMKISRKHVTEDDFNYVCSECGKKFANKTRLKDHVDWEHLKTVNHRCNICNKPFKSNTSLYVHMQNVHKSRDEKDNLCHVCGKSYQNTAKLKYHIVAMHTTETPYTCEFCPSSFSWYSSLYRHVKEVHQKVKMKKKRPARKPGAPPSAPGTTPTPLNPITIHHLQLPPMNM